MAAADDVASSRARPAPLSSGNSRVKEARKLARRASRAAQGRFLADGPKAVAGALELPGCVLEVFATEEASARYADLRARAPRWTLVDDRALGSLSDSVTPAGVVAVCRSLDASVADVVAAPGAGGRRLTAICAEVRDPGNAGTVIRTADAAGAGGVVLAGTSVDPYNPKVVRATAGSLFHLPLAVVPEAERAVEAARDAGLTVLAATGSGETDLDEAIDTGLLGRPTAWVFGNEAHGLPPDLAGLADHRVRIPIHGRAESLNLSTAAAVCLYASARAMRHGTG